MYEIVVCELGKEPSHSYVSNISFNEARAVLSNISRRFVNEALIPDIHHVRIGYRNSRNEFVGLISMIREDVGTYELNDFGDTLASSITRDMNRLAFRANNRVAESLLFHSESAFNFLVSEITSSRSHSDTEHMYFKSLGTRRGYQSVKSDKYAPYSSNNGVGIIRYMHYALSPRYRLAQVYILKNQRAFVKEWFERSVNNG